MIKQGQKYPTNNYGDIEVIDVNQSGKFCTVRFTKTGTRKKFRTSQILSGCIRDPYAASVCGVAKTGDVKTKGKNHTYYSIWHDMINRCYNKNNKRSVSYKNVSVSERWLTFENFLSDVSKIDGFDEEKIMNGDLVLDKDLKQRWEEAKVYSLDRCAWITKHENALMQDFQQRRFVAVSPAGEQYIDYNMTRFAKEHGLERRHISGVLHGRAKTTQGWSFRYL